MQNVIEIGPAQAEAASKVAGWREIAVAMAKSGAGAAASGLLSALTAKIVAVVLGPAEVAVLATLQQVRQSALIAATANGDTALVQGACAFRGRERDIYIRSVAMIFAAGTIVAALLLVLGRNAIARYVGLDAARAPMIAWLALPVALTAMFVFRCGLLNARGAIGRLAMLQVIAAGASAMTAIPVVSWIVRGGSNRWLVAVLTVSAAAALGGALWWSRGLGANRAGEWSWSAARHFFSIAGAMAVTGFAGSLAVVAVRARIVHVEGLAAAGMFDAAWAVSMTHVTLILASMRTFYQPSLARAATAEERAALIGKMLASAAAVSAPAIAVLTLAKPLVIAALYSSAFHPAADYLRWTLAGDYLKITAWILTTPMIATADMLRFATLDLAAWLSLWAGAALLAAWLRPGTAAAIAFTAMYAWVSIAAWWNARRRYGFRAGRKTAAIWWGGAGLVAIASWAGWRA